MTAVLVGELLLDEGDTHSRPEPADLGPDGEAVVLKGGGGDEGVGWDHGPVTGLAAEAGHAPHPANLHPQVPARPLGTFVAEAVAARLESGVWLVNVSLIIFTVGVEDKIQVHWDHVLLVAVLHQGVELGGEPDTEEQRGEQLPPHDWSELSYCVLCTFLNIITFHKHIYQCGKVLHVTRLQIIVFVTTSLPHYQQMTNQRY